MGEGSVDVLELGRLDGCNKYYFGGLQDDCVEGLVNA